MIKYNSQRGKINIREYGRHIQHLVEYTKKVEDRSERNKLALCIIELMALLFPHTKSVEDFKHKLWDHLFVIADFELDVDAPYPVPSREIITRKPDRLIYPKNKIKFRHYGKSVEILISKALLEEDKAKQQDFAQAIATVMKMTYRNFNHEGVVDDTIKDDLVFMSNGGLKLAEDAGINNMPLRNNTDNNVIAPVNRNRNNRNNRNRNQSGGGGNNERRSNSGANPNNPNFKRKFNKGNNRNNNPNAPR